MKLIDFTQFFEIYKNLPNISKKLDQVDTNSNICKSELSGNNFIENTYIDLLLICDRFNNLLYISDTSKENYIGSKINLESFLFDNFSFNKVAGSDSNNGINLFIDKRNIIYFAIKVSDTISNEAIVCVLLINLGRNYKNSIALPTDYIKFKLIAENSPGLTKISNYYNYYYFFNENWHRFSNIFNDELLSSKWFDFIDKDYYNNVLYEINVSFKKRSKYSIKYVMCNNENDKKLFIDKGEPYFDSKNFFLGYISSAYDISEDESIRQIQEKELIRTEISKSFMKSMDDASLIVLGIDKNDMVLYANKYAFKNFNINKLNLPVSINNILEVEVKRDLSVYTTLSNISTRQIISRYRSSRINDKVNTSLYSLTFMSFDLGDSTEILYFSCQDISEIEFRKSEVMLNEKKYLNIINSMQDLYFKVSKNLILLEVNNVVYELLGYDPFAILNTDINNIVLEFPKSEKKKLLKKSNSTKVTIKLLDSNQNIHYFDCKIRIAYDPVLNIVCFLGVARDVTQLLNYQTNLQKQNKKIKKLLKYKDDFMANMSHEIRTPLNGIIGMTDLLLKQEFSSLTINKLLVIKESADLLLNTVNDILDTSKIASGKFSINKSHFKLKELSNYYYNFFTPLFNDKEIKFTIQQKYLDDTVIYSDPNRIKQIIGNLLSNSYKFTSHGYVIFSISVLDKLLTFTVEDSGSGISKTKQKDIFTPFFQEDNSTKKNYQGTGLGLYLSKSLSNLLGGNLEYRPNQPMGSKFIFSLPNVDLSAASDDNIPLIIDSNNLNTNFKLRILLVDDNKINREVSAALMNECNQIIYTVDSAISCLKFLENYQVDIIFLDIQMPEFDGIYCLKEIQSRKLSDASIIALTAYSMPGDRDKFINLGFHDYLPKPLSLFTISKFIISYNYDYVSDKLIDYSVIQTIINALGIHEFNETLDMFFEEVKDLSNAISKKHTHQNSVIFHTIKGSASTLGLISIANHSQILEMWFKQDFFSYNPIYPIQLINLSLHCVNLVKSHFNLPSTHEKSLDS